MNFGAAADGADGVRDLVERGLIARGQQQIAAGAGKFKRDASADAAARAGHQRDLALKFKFIGQSIADRPAVNRPASSSDEHQRDSGRQRASDEAWPLMPRP